MIKKQLLAMFILLFISGCTNKTSEEKQNDAKPAEYALVIHGGAGNVTPERIPPEKEAEYRAVLQQALNLGSEWLKNDSPSVAVVEAVIQLMENSPLFNAGKGAVFNAEGKIEHDASIMDGNQMKAGAVASVNTIKNPISAARLVMEKSPHVMMVREGAIQFARENGLEIVDSSYFFTQERYNDLLRLQGKIEKYGTVGCVALDKKGNIAAGTSTGGMSNKKYGRIGDAPIIGAGTYASNATCGVSCTGHGEFFIRYNVAADVSARMKYGNQSLQKASEDIINELFQKEGMGGLIALDKLGNISMPFNTDGMFRGYTKANGENKVLLFKEK